jgi:glycerate dehydrogenase
MTRIVFLDRSTMGPALKLSRPSFEHEWIEYDRTRAQQVVERLRDCDIAISNKVPIRRDSIEMLPQLKMIAIPATGYDAFDVEACIERGIVISNVTGYAHQLGARAHIRAHPCVTPVAVWISARRHCGDMAGS